MTHWDLNIAGQENQHRNMRITDLFYWLERAGATDSDCDAIIKLEVGKSFTPVDGAFMVTRTS